MGLEGGFAWFRGTCALYLVPELRRTCASASPLCFLGLLNDWKWDFECYRQLRLLRGIVGCVLGPQLGVVRCVLSLCLHVLTEASWHSCPTSVARQCEGFSVRGEKCLGLASHAEWSGVHTVTPPYVPVSSLGTPLLHLENVLRVDFRGYFGLKSR